MSQNFHSSVKSSESHVSTQCARGLYNWRIKDAISTNI